MTAHAEKFKSLDRAQKANRKRGTKAGNSADRNLVLLSLGDRSMKAPPEQETDDSRDTYDRRTVEELVHILKELNGKKFYGELLIKYEAGHIVYIKKTECIKLMAKQVT